MAASTTRRCRWGANHSMNSYMNRRRKVPRRKPMWVMEGAKRWARVYGAQIRVNGRVESHAGDNADAKAQADVCFDDVGVGGGEGHPRLQSSCTEGLVKRGAAGEPNT